MSEAARQVEMVEAFLDKLSRFEQFANHSNAAGGRKFTAAVFAFCYEIIAPLPLAYPAFQLGAVVRQDVRRAMFRRHYVLLYRVTDATVVFLDIFHTSQRPSDLLDSLTLD